MIFAHINMSKCDGIELLSKGMNEWMHKGNNRKAIVYFDKAIKLDRTLYWVFYGKGMALFFMNNLKEAEKCLKMVVKLHKTHAAAWSNLAGIQERLGKKREAKKSREMAHLTNKTHNEEVKRRNQKPREKRVLHT